MKEPGLQPIRDLEGLGPLGRFMLGAGCLWDGLTLTLGHPKLRLLAIAAIALNLLVFAALVAAGLLTLPYLLEQIGLEEGGVWWWVVAIAIGIVWALLSALLALLLASVVASPVYEALSERTEALMIPGREPPGFSLVQTVLHALRDVVLQVAIILPVAVVILLIGLIPVVGQILSPVLGWAWTAFWTSLELMLPAVERHGIGLRGRMAFVGRHKALFLGLGAIPAVFPFLLVPLFAPAFVVAGTRVFVSLALRGQVPGVSLRAT